jgi:PAS domain S-box-containing protein
MDSSSPASASVADVLDHIQDGVFVLDAEGRFVFVNSAAARILTRPRESLLGKNIWEVFPQAVGGRSHLEYQRLQVEPGTREYEEFFPGIGRWIEMRVWSRNGRLTASSRDVTERRAMDERLRRSEARFLSLMKATRQAVWVTSPDGTVTEDIPEWRAFTGLSFEDTVGMGWLSAIHPDDRAETSTAWKSACERQRIFEVNQRLRRHDGVYRHMSVRAVPICDAAGTVIEWVGTSTDVTEKILAEREQRERAWLLAETQRLAQVGSASWDLESGAAAWSDELRRIWGSAAGEDPKSIDDFIARVHPDDQARVSATIRDAIREGRRQLAYGLRFRRPDGEVRHTQVSAEIQYADDGRPLRFIAAVQDVTDREHAAAAQRELERKVVKAQKLESLGVLAGGVAHDVNNLLVGILGNVTVALAEVGPTPSLVEPLSEIVTTAQRAAGLAHQLLAYSGKGRFAVAPLDVSALLLASEVLLGTAIARGATLRVEAPPELPFIEADSAQVSQVILNLVTNASDALGAAAGTVTVRSGVLHATPELLRSTFVDDHLPEGEYVLVEVADSGRGMTPDTVARMFDPFFTTKRSGHGLGLAATLGIVRGHRGAIKVESDPGKGSRVTVLFPAIRSREIVAAPRAASSARAGGTVLVVDDDDLVRRVAKRMLVKAGYAVLEAEHGKAALAVFDAHRSEIALVLLDLSMPVMGGEETFGALRALDPGLPIVLSSGYNEDDATSRFVGRGLAGFVQKPFVMNDLLATVLQTKRV